MSSASGRSRASLASSAEDFESLVRLAFAQQAAGEWAAAVELYRRCLTLDPGSAEVHNNLGAVLERTGRLSEAIECFREAQRLRPDYVRPLVNLGKALRSAGDPQAAAESLDRALELAPDNPLALTNRGFLLTDLGRLTDAVGDLRRALAIDPRLAEAHFGLGRALVDEGALEPALESLRRATALNPDLADAQILCGRVLMHSGQRLAAMWHFQQALAVNPRLADAHCYLGLATLYASGNVHAALACFDRALEANPMHHDALVHRAGALTMLQELAAARASIEQALALQPDDSDTLAEKLNCCMKMCDWVGIQSAWKRLCELPAAADRAHPFVLMAVCDDPQQHLRAAQTHARTSIPRGGSPRVPPRAATHGRIRVAYVSRDFCVHATLSLIAELLELHERRSFEVLGVSFGPDDSSPMRRRAIAAFDQFIDARAMTDVEVVSLLREREVDIAVDLKGYTALARPGIFAQRAAPVQVSYLGYPGTMGADFIDYIIADEFLIPQSERQFYSECIAYLPDSYQVNDRRRRVAEAFPPRSAVGLPEEAVVLCCFNNNWKISEPVFAVWMRVLERVEGSVLWLLEDNAWAAASLRQAAARRGISPERLIFCGRLPADEHLARHRLADLFLDTLPYNAHTTASDALWAGLPVITCSGRSFAARVAGSLLRAVGLPELVTASLAEYEELAVSLARDPRLLQSLRARLREHREAKALFDAPRFCRHLEAAYRHMWLRQRCGAAPETFKVGVDGP